jgi:hypothetical protein
MLRLPPGEGGSVLYVGDHLYADVVRTKRSMGWRTCLIVPELTKEIFTHKRLRARRLELMQLRRRQHSLESRLDRLMLGPGAPSTEARLIAEEVAALRLTVRGRLEEYNAAFHPRWGQLFKAGFQESRIAKQVKEYACLYTSRASNLGLVSPFRPFRPVRDTMPHDHMLTLALSISAELDKSHSNCDSN